MGMSRGAVGVGAVLAAAVALSVTGCTASVTPDHTARARAATPSPTPTASCLVGEWTAGAATLQPLYDAIPTPLDYPAATLGATSSVVVTFTGDGSFTFTQDVPVTLTWEDHPAAVHLAGTMRGAYRTTGDRIRLTAVDDELTAAPSDSHAASALFAAATQETLDEWPVSARTARCSGDRLELGLVTEGHPATLALTRR